MFAIYKKELKVYFTSILGYAVMGIYLLIAGIFFYGSFIATKSPSDFSGFFGDMNTAFLFIIPILTLRILAEDKKLGTFELLLTSPIKPWGIILGKFLAVFTFVCLGATILLVYPAVLSFYTGVEWGAVFAGYLGMLFSLALYISIGMFASSVTENYVVAGLLSFGFFILLYVISVFGNMPDSVFSRFLKEISYSNHYGQFTSGLIKARDVLYFLIGSYIWLYLSKTVIESRTWK
jgi:ABC-2 type transport system permease protein